MLPVRKDIRNQIGELVKRVLAEEIINTKWWFAPKRGIRIELIMFCKGLSNKTKQSKERASQKVRQGF